MSYFAPSYSNLLPQSELRRVGAHSFQIYVMSSRGTSIYSFGNSITGNEVKRKEDKDNTVFLCVFE